MRMQSITQPIHEKKMQESNSQTVSEQLIIPYSEEYEGLRCFQASYRLQYSLKCYREHFFHRIRFSNARFRAECMINRLIIHVRPLLKNTANGEVSRNYNKYASSIEKVLRSFEGVDEWTDLISALSRLNKVNIEIECRQLRYTV